MFSPVSRAKYVILTMLVFYALPVFPQEPIVFTKHKRINNLITGTKAGFELPVYVGAIQTSDYEFDGTEGKSPVYFGISPKFTLKNGWGRGIGLGVGMDYTTHKYARANLLLDLDFLFAYSIPMNEKGTRFTVSMFTKYEMTKILAKVDGQTINEYYLSFNIMKMQIGKLAFLEMGKTLGLMRNKYAPHFADKGTYFKISYFIR